MFGKKRFRREVDEDRVQRAIEEAERRTSGEIRVSVAPFFWGNVERGAERAFSRLGMTATRERNGILFFIVPSRRAFVVRGDEEIHARVGQEFWHEVIRVMTPHFRAGRFTDGLCAGIAAAGEKLSEHFPYDAERDVNELPNRVDRPP